jgi:hypothetical protein
MHMRAEVRTSYNGQKYARIFTPKLTKRGEEYHLLSIYPATFFDGGLPQGQSAVIHLNPKDHGGGRWAHLTMKSDYSFALRTSNSLFAELSLGYLCDLAKEEGLEIDEKVVEPERLDVLHQVLQLELEHKLARSEDRGKKLWVFDQGLSGQYEHHRGYIGRYHRVSVTDGNRRWRWFWYHGAWLNDAGGKPVTFDYLRHHLGAEVVQEILDWRKTHGDRR